MVLHLQVHLLKIQIWHLGQQAITVFQVDGQSVLKETQAMNIFGLSLKMWVALSAIWIKDLVLASIHLMVLLGIMFQILFLWVTILLFILEGKMA